MIAISRTTNGAIKIVWDTAKAPTDAFYLINLNNVSAKVKQEQVSANPQVKAQFIIIEYPGNVIKIKYADLDTINGAAKPEAPSDGLDLIANTVLRGAAV